LIHSQDTCEVEGKVRLRVQLPNGTFTGPSLTSSERRDVFQQMQLILNGNSVRYTQSVKQDGKFVFEHIPPGAYFLEINSPHFKYEPMRIEINKKFNTVTVKTFTTNKKLAYPPLVITPLTPMRYFEEEKQLNVLGFLFQNKMMLIMIFMTVMMLGMQKLAGPDMMKELVGAAEEEQFLPSFDQSKEKSE